MSLCLPFRGEFSSVTQKGEMFPCVPSERRTMGMFHMGFPHPGSGRSLSSCITHIYKNFNEATVGDNKEMFTPCYHEMGCFWYARLAGSKNKTIPEAS